MRATQKKMMSKPVTKTEEGKKCSNSLVCLGQPNELNGTSAELNQVSKTSSSRFRDPEYPVAFALLFASSSERATKISPASPYQAGI